MKASAGPRTTTGRRPYLQWRQSWSLDHWKRSRQYLNSSSNILDNDLMLDLNDFFYFVQVVDRGGFTAAGRTLRLPKSTLSHRIQELETNLGVRLLNRTSRRFAMTDAGEEFYRHAVAMLREAELAETAIRHRLSEPTGTVRCTAAVATMQFAMRDIVADFLVRYTKVNVVAHATA